VMMYCHENEEEYKCVVIASRVSECRGILYERNEEE
jgi:hypothetical protein